MNARLWTDAEDEIVRAQYPTGSIDAIAAQLGRARHGICNRASELGVRRRTALPCTAVAMTLAARIQGVRASEIGHHDVTLAGSILSRLVKTGKLFRAALGRRTVSYFTTQKAADRFYAANIAAHVAKQAPHIPKNSPASRWAADAPMVFTAKTKYTYGNPPPAMVWYTNTHAR